MPGARLITVLRDPVRRIVSDYHHQRSARHPSHAAFRERFATLESYAEAKSEQEKAAQHLISPAVLAARDPGECVAHLMRSYAFVGVQEEYTLCFRALTALIGAPETPRLRENIGVADSAEAVPEELARRIRAANPIDAALHEAALGGWRRIGAALSRYLDALAAETSEKRNVC
jgi:thioredoxin-like negative regulator of GroEL